MFNKISRHQPGAQIKDIDHQVQLVTTNESVNHDKGRQKVVYMK